MHQCDTLLTVHNFARLLLFLFLGAVKILRQAKEIDFKLLYSGKLCFDELNRIKRIRRASIKLPHFMEDISAYRHALREICFINGLAPCIVRYVHFNPIPEDKMAKIYGNKGTSRRFSSAKLKSRKRDELKFRETNKVDHFINCEIFAIKPLARVQGRVK